MAMQLFTFGHPCEHQLRRQCIGGKSCPLCGYPNEWCCSYIKGKINFKRDKPCEGSRCRWNYQHPPQSLFDAVTQVLNESRPIALKIDEGDDKEILALSIDNHHIVDTVQCALQMLRNPPSTYSARVGQLLAYAALRARDTKVFMQLLKTMKKPVDGYILGAYDYLMRGTIPAPLNSSSNTVGGNANNNSVNSGNNNSAGSNQGRAAAKKAGTGSNGNNSSNNNNNDKKEDIADELKSDMVDLMNAALSSGGQLVDREDQHTLQAVFIQSLRSYPKSNKKRQEMLESAVAMFGSKPGPRSTTAAVTAVEQTPPNNISGNSNSPPTTAAVVTNATNNNNNNNNNSAASRAGSVAAATGGAVPGARTVARVVEAAQDENVSVPQRSGSFSNTNNSSGNSGNASYVNVCSAGAGATTAAAVVAAAVAAAGAPSRRPQGTTGSTTPVTPVSTRSKEPCVPTTTIAPTTTVQPTRQQQQQQQQQRPPPPIVGISQLVQQPRQPAACRYEPIRTDLPLPNITLFGGLFGLTTQSAAWAPLGAATSRKTSPPSLPGVVVGSGAATPGLAADMDEKAFRFLSPTTSGVNFFGGIDSLPPEHQLLKGICDD
ncbi:uncharacterized protein TEOVI_000015400 [Trypanosoma equiperdum]|uniref:Uncharacterized protein n=2 Tax=Trypanozoon TaxID=39700 RepID=Q580H3_TRYB2|nr:hypothetical protein, conserved [Trypanosoma brucei brucei TREU927]AAX79787.1 hypothetical protein, conserved [Trypanosoma brucei]AAZ12918.1 hypothetical protein, conserved [Trypanosoma brucei brucei TREU927]SCU65213.1 hypothetical protein, conserved [Trypanosoma equiperdum]